MASLLIKSFESCHPKRVSYVLTTKNRSAYLDRALRQAKSLLKAEDELIIIDGASTDATPEVLRRHQDIIDIAVSEPDMSPAHALNKGILIARGKYIKQLTDDDIVYPEAMEKVVKIFETYPDVDMLFCGGTKEDGEGRRSVVYLPPGTNYGVHIQDAFEHKISGIGFVFRRSVFTKVGLHPNGWASDIEFPALCIARGALVKFCRVHLYTHMIYDGNVTKRRSVEHRRDARRIVRQYSTLSYYIEYSLRELMHSHIFLVWLGIIVLPLHLIRFLRMRGIVGGYQWLVQRSQTTTTSKQYLWDGGFS